MPARGHRVSEETRALMRAARARHKPHVIGKYGITEEIYREQIAVGNIWCSDCKQFRFPECFGVAGRKTRCLECQRKRNVGYKRKDPEKYRRQRHENYMANFDKRKREEKLRRWGKFGVDQTWYDNKLVEQGGGCAICGKLQAPRYLAVDHSHECCPAGMACDKCRRGLLCGRCNMSLERLEAIPGWLENAVAYLRKYGEPCVTLLNS